MSEWVYVHEDDWGRISLEADENRVERARVAEQVRAFSAAHRVPGSMFWSDAMVVPEVPIALATRRITMRALREVLGPEVRPLAGVTSGYGSGSEPVPDAYAFACAPPDTHWNILYGLVNGEDVTQLHLTFGTPELADVLHRLGTTFSLILCHLGADIVDLTRRDAIDRYLAED